MPVLEKSQNFRIFPSLLALKKNKADKIFLSCCLHLHSTNVEMKGKNPQDVERRQSVGKDCFGVGLSLI